MSAEVDELAWETGAGNMRYRTSVSQIKMFHPGAGGCPRKWALHYLSKVRRLPSIALADGIRLHECTNQYYTLARDEWERRWPTFWQPGLTADQEARVKTAQLALAMIQYAPRQPGPGTHSERTWMLDVSELDTSIFIKPDLDGGPDRPFGLDWFADWKTTSARTKKSDWCLQEPEFWGDDLSEQELAALNAKGVRWLQDDIQARVYAHGLMHFWNVPRIRARWIYGSKKFKPTEAPKVWVVEAEFEQAETRDWVEQFVWPTIRTMNTIRAAFETGKLDSTLLVPHNGDSCEHTGKFCDALGQCGFKPSPIPMGRLHLPVLPGSH